MRATRKIISICLFSLAFIHSIVRCAFQPLQLQSPISMYFQYGNINLDYPILRQSKADVLFCFTQSTVSNKPYSSQGDIRIQTCFLNDSSLNYLCVRLFNQNSITTFSYEVFYKQIDQTLISTQPSQDIKRVSSTLSQNLTNNYSITLQSQALTQTLVFTDYFKNKSIYHMFTCPNYNKNTDTCGNFWKQNYLHTFKHPQKKINLIVQRKHNCAVFYRTFSANPQIITSHIFYGGTLRAGKYYMFVAVLTYSNNQNDVLSMWGGISYSNDHANRDMFCFATDGSAFDAVSLIAGPVYKDVAQNINGTDDAEIVDIFYSERYKRYWMYFIQYHRPYETVNQIGDERIFKKIYAQFSYAAFFDYVDQTQKTIKTPSCLSSTYKHNLLIYFPSDVEVFQTKISIQIILVVVLIFIAI